MIGTNEQDMDLDTFLESLMNPEYKPKFPFSFFFSEGCKYFRISMYKKAIERLDEALQTQPTNVQVMLTRAKIHIRLQQYEKAIEDATEAMQLWPSYSEIYDLKGQAEYLKGDFEGAYLTYLAGRQIRPDIKELRLGHQLCGETLGNSMVGMYGPAKLETDDKWKSKLCDVGIRFAKKSRNRIPTYERFSKDKSVLKELLSDEKVSKIHDVCKESLNFIETSERFWAMEKPLYTRRKASYPENQIAKKGTIAQYVAATKTRCLRYLQSGFTNLCIAEGQKLVELLESKPDMSRELLIKLKADVYHLLSFAYEIKPNVALCLQSLIKELEVSLESEYMYPQIRAYHHLGMHYLKKKEFENACSCFTGVIEALNPERLRKFLQNRKKYSTEMDESNVIDEEIREIEAAEIWARDFKENIDNLIPQPRSNKFFLEVIPEGIGLKNFLNENLNQSESNESEVYFSTEENGQSNESFFSTVSEKSKESE
ncbi:tetratricopeptide repeat protein 25 [Caerostris extrusa]|uniref:Outer dynein arm-docking complex subunit 4 n=1 Tax=Caerostris extrusa TaxID=172846 RepID=A0AAV4TN69_CAEEX|nr:tetratricopeptide repeat protein 25 [Caerostris extrusa]